MQEHKMWLTVTSEADTENERKLVIAIVVITTHQSLFKFILSGPPLSYLSLLNVNFAICSPCLTTRLSIC